MWRGYFKFVTDFPEYKVFRKFWYIELVQSDCFWYDLIVHPPKFENDENYISSYLRSLKKHVEETLERRFIYFFCSRPKIRFDIRRKPRYELFKGHLVINLLVGKNQKKVSIRISLPKSFDSIKPQVELTDKFIRIYNCAGGSITYSVHDFLRTIGCTLGYSTEVHYVGLTKNPQTRPLDRKHRGVSDTLYNISNEERDFFLLVNLFKITAMTTSNNFGVYFMIGNGLSDDVPVNQEGEIIESGFVSYFDSPIQKEEQSHERAALENSLKRIRSDLSIDYVIFDFELEKPDEYFRLSSANVVVSDRHIFCCGLNDKGLVVENLGSEFDFQQHFMKYIDE
jgi:hypothetical protein